MKKEINLAPPRQLAEFITPPRWTAFGFLIASILLILYMLFRLKIRWKRLVNDYHLQLRCSLVLLLLINRLAHLAQLFAVTTGDVYWDAYVTAWNTHIHKEDADINPVSIEYYDLFLVQVQPFEDVWLATKTAQKALLFVVYAAFYANLILMLFLLIDRYTRITITLPGSRLYSFFWLVRFCSVFSGFYSTVCLGFKYFANDPSSIRFSDTRVYVEYSINGICMLVYYFFTIRLMRQCLLVNHVHRHSVWQVMLHKLLQHPLSSPDSLPDKKDVKRLTLFLRMTMWLIFMMIADAAMFVFVGLSILDSVIEYDDRLAIGFSWMPLHVFCTYQLLDLFLQELKRLDQPTLSHASVPWYKAPFCKLFPHKTEVTDTSDIVDMSLIPVESTSLMQSTDTSSFKSQPAITHVQSIRK